MVCHAIVLRSWCTCINVNKPSIELCMFTSYRSPSLARYFFWWLRWFSWGFVKQIQEKKTRGIKKNRDFSSKLQMCTCRSLWYYILNLVSFYNVCNMFCRYTFKNKVIDRYKNSIKNRDFSSKLHIYTRKSFWFYWI